MMKHKRLIFLIAILALVCIAGAVDIKNSGLKVTNGRVDNPVGTAALPGITFSGDPNTGISDATDSLVFSTNGVARQTCDTSFCYFDLPLIDTVNACGVTYYPGMVLRNLSAATLGNVQYSPMIEWDGSACNTAYACVSTNESWNITNEPVQGNPTTSVMTFNQRTAAAAYGTRMSLTSGGVLSPTGKMQTGAGSAAAPSIGFIGDPNTGLSNTADTISFDANGHEKATCDDTNWTMKENLIFSADNTYDIGASGATRPRTGYFGTDVNVGGDVNVTDDVACNQMTATVPGIGATSTTYDQSRNGVILNNSTASVAGPGVTTQVSPGLEMLSHAWASGAGADDTWSWKILNVPITGATTTSKLSFESAQKVGGAAWGTYTTGLSLTPRAGFPTVIDLTGPTDITAGEKLKWQIGNGLLQYGTMFGIATQINAISILATSSFNIGSNNTDGATAVGVRVGHTGGLSTPGAKLVSFMNATVEKSSIDKDGVYHQGYASGQVTDAVPSLDLTLVTAMDDDSIYDLVVGCEYIGYAAGAVGTPTFWFASSIGATFSRVDTVAAEVGTNTSITHKESAAGCVPCAVSTVDAGGAAADIIKVTFTQCDLAADVANVKAWIDRMHKTNITQPFTGVNQPAAN